MPRLANERNELYCFHRAKGMVPKKAQVAAGYAQGSSTHAQLEEDPETQARILELTHELQLKREQQRAAAMQAAQMVGKVTGITKAWVIGKLAENAIAAKDDGDYGESNAALTLIGKEYGMFQGGSAIRDGEDEQGQTIDTDATRALLDAAEGAMSPPLPEAEERPPIDLEAVERLISGNKRVNPKDRELKTGSETDVAFKPDADPDVED